MLCSHCVVIVHHILSVPRFRAVLFRCEMCNPVSPELVAVAGPDEGPPHHSAFCVRSGQRGGTTRAREHHRPPLPSEKCSHQIGNRPTHGPSHVVCTAVGTKTWQTRDQHAYVFPTICFSNRQMIQARAKLVCRAAEASRALRTSCSTRARLSSLRRMRASDSTASSCASCLSRRTDSLTALPSLR